MGFTLERVRRMRIRRGQSAATAADRLVGEFFAIQNGWIREIHAVLFNMPDAMPTGWPTTDYGPGKASAEYLRADDSNRVRTTH